MCVSQSVWVIIMKFWAESITSQKRLKKPSKSHLTASFILRITLGNVPREIVINCAKDRDRSVFNFLRFFFDFLKLIISVFYVMYDSDLRRQRSFLQYFFWWWRCRWVLSSGKKSQKILLEINWKAGCVLPLTVQDFHSCFHLRFFVWKSNLIQNVTHVMCHVCDVSRPWTIIENFTVVNDWNLRFNSINVFNKKCAWLEQYW